MFSDPNGLADDGRVGAFLVVLGYIAIAGWDVMVNKKPFDPQQYGIGAGALFAGVGAMFGIRKGN